MAMRNGRGRRNPPSVLHQSSMPRVGGAKPPSWVCDINLYPDFALTVLLVIWMITSESPLPECLLQVLSAAPVPVFSSPVPLLRIRRS
ncbi:hypothetical protein [Streptomyces syringium]|uniref:hypothetical protein n=1 Tax=Streptomyces syringium TaxID=76729 RepID=UPI00343D2EC2